MITIDLRKEKYTLDELLALSTSETLMIYDKDGKHYILEETDDFEEEVEKLGNSDKFLKFLSERSKEKDTIPISSIAEKLGIKIKHT
jgi:Pyruvate/2-oxoacid:ferredoxin oxidoreductase gamma subunit